MKTCSIFFLLVLLSMTPAFAEDFEKTEFTGSSGTALHYALMKPELIEDGKSYPLVITLHGVGGRGAKNWERNCHANAVLASAEMRRKHPCFVAAPTTSGPSRSWSGRLGDLFELIEKLASEQAVDRQRIYVTGQSMGGYGTFAAIVQRPQLFAAAGPVCGGNQPQNAAAIAELPMWIFHGAIDTTVPVERSREMVEAIKQAGGDPKYTEFANVAHNAWTPAYDNAEFWAWLFKQVRQAQ